MKTSIYIAVRGGIVQGVRATKKPHHSDGYECYVVDYDNFEHDENVTSSTEVAEALRDFERDATDGHTWDELEATTVGVF